MGEMQPWGIDSPEAGAVGTSKRCNLDGEASAGGRSFQFKRVEVSLGLPGGGSKDLGGRQGIQR